MNRLLVAVALLIGSAVSASATCTGPALMHDFPGTSFNMSLATVPDGNCGSNVALPTWAGGTLGAMANYGTSPGAVLVPGVNASVTASALPTGAATSANQATEITSLGTIATNSGTQATAANQTTANTSLATIATNTGAAIPAGTARIGYVSDDPCSQKIKLNAPFSTTSAGPVSIVALSGSTVVYVCSISAITDTAIKLSFIDGTGGSCAAAQHAIWGSTTAANGMSLAANGGFTQGSGSGSVGVTTAASALCLLQSGTSLVSGNVTYVQQ